jgi:hypothetical protein
MQYAENSGGASFTDDCASIVFSVSGVNNDWKIDFARQGNLRGKSSALCRARRVVVVVIESTFANRDGTGFHQCTELRQIPLAIERRSVVRVDSGRRENKARILRRIGRSGGSGVERLADADDRRRARFPGAGDYLVAVAGERRVREVGVAVDEDRRASVLRGHLRSIQRRTGDAT